MTFFTLASLFFGAFTLGYVLFAFAIVYHLRQYTLPGSHLPALVISLFGFLSGLLWLFGLYFLLTIPR